MFSLIYNFIFRNRNKLLTIQAFCFTAWYSLLLRFVPVAKLRPFMGCEGVETPCDELTESEAKKAGIISRLVNRVASRTPWHSKCFVRALTAQRMLYAAGLFSTLYLGVGKDENNKMIAHAWLRCGQYYITGGDGKDYTQVSKFAKTRV